MSIAQGLNPLFVPCMLSPRSGPLPSPNPQVLAPLLRRFMSLRTRLLDNDRAAKKRLDLAAEHLK